MMRRRLRGAASWAGILIVTTLALAAYRYRIDTGQAVTGGGCEAFNPAAQGWRHGFKENFDTLDASDGTASRWPSQFLWQRRHIAENREAQLYVDPRFAGTTGAPLGLNPLVVEDSILAISASEAEPSVRAKLGDPDARYISGLLTTAHSFQQIYGYFEIRARLPPGRGLWPALWLLPPDGTWLPEIDVFEMFGQDPRMIFVAVHSAESGAHKGVTRTVPVADTAEGFHAFALRWAPNQLTWFFDGCRIGEMRTPADLHRPMYMVLKLAVGGTWATYPDRTTHFPTKFLVDHVRAYERPGEAVGPQPGISDLR